MNKRSTSLQISTGSALLAVAVMLAGCFEPSAPELMASGKSRMEKRDFRAAAIDFKNVLQKNSGDVEARFLLGKALLEAGDLPAAKVELTKARDAGYSNDELVPVMAAALLYSGESDKFLTEYGELELTSPKRQAELKAMLATVYGAKGRFAQARVAADAALHADPDNLMAHMAVAQLLLASGDRVGALAQAERTISAHPKSGRPWVAMADLLQATDAEPAKVVAAYREALSIEKGNMLAHIGVVQLLLRQRDFDGAQKQLADMERAQPNTVQGRYLKTWLAFERRDLPAAHAMSQELLKMAPQNASFLFLAGSIEYERGAYLQAIAHLGKALQTSATPAAVRVLLARAQLRAGDARKALSYVQPLLEADIAAPAEVYSVAADCHLQLGNGEAAKKMYAEAVKRQPGDARGRTALALSMLGEGRTDQAMAELKSVAASSTSNEAEIVLIMAHIRGNRFADAQAVIDGLERKQPGEPVAPYFQARIAQMQGQREKAREFYERALARRATYDAAVAALAAMDLEDGKPGQVVARYEKYVTAAPKSVEARLGLIAARARVGVKNEDVRAQLAEAVKMFPESNLPRLMLIGNLLDHGDAKAALQIAAEGVARFPDDAGALQAQGLAEFAAGNHHQAAQVLGKLVALRPNSVEPLMLLADVELARMDTRSALAQLRKALVMKPGHLPAQTRLIATLARTGKADEAMRVVKDIQGRAPSDAHGWLYEGELLATQGNKAGAVAAFRTAHAKGPSDQSAIKLHTTLLVAGQAAEAAKLASDWQASRPDSTVFTSYLGDQALARRDYESAEQHYQKVVTTQPSNVAALNNLAWLLHRAGKPGAAQFGERALALAPNSPSALDTMAEIHDGMGQPGKALALQKRAVEIAPDRPAHRLHLAKYLIKNNQKAEARSHLQQLSALGGSFAQQEEVQKLLSTL